jgi:hypothetical protein
MRTSKHFLDYQNGASKFSLSSRKWNSKANGGEVKMDGETHRLAIVETTNPGAHASAGHDNRARRGNYLLRTCDTLLLLRRPS